MMRKCLVFSLSSTALLIAAIYLCSSSLAGWDAIPFVLAAAGILFGAGCTLIGLRQKQPWLPFAVQLGTALLFYLICLLSHLFLSKLLLLSFYFYIFWIYLVSFLLAGGLGLAICVRFDKNLDQ